MRAKPWDSTYEMPWATIKKEWDRYWDTSKPVLLEKSPPNILRASEIAAHFQPLQFVLMVRNPYAHAEGLMRRNKWKVSRAANFACMCLRVQLRNARELENALVLSYESLVADPQQSCRDLAAFLPALSDLDPEASFAVHSVDGTVHRPITDLNEKKIASIPSHVMMEFNAIFEEHEGTLAAWGYEILSP